MKDIENDEFFHTLFDCISEVTLYLDITGKIEKADPNLTKMIGYSVEELVATPLHEYLVESEQNIYGQMIQEVIQGKPINMDSIFLHTNGENIPVHMILVPVRVEGSVTGVLGVIKERAEVPAMESNSILSIDKFKSIAEDAIVGVYIIKDEHLIYGNPYYHQLLGTKYPEVNFNVFNFIHPDDLQQTYTAINSLVDGEVGITHHARLVRPDGTRTRVEAHSKLIYLDKEPLILGTVIDITEREKARERINYLSYFDDLTELPNRKSFEETLERDIIIAKTLNQKLSIMYLDLDRFKYTNDALGHYVGNKLLKAISKRFQIVLGDKYQLFRINGDEFAVIAADCVKINSVVELANQLISAMEDPFVVDSFQLFMTTSIGISLFPTDGEDSISLMKKADAALYHAKQEGKNTYRVYSSTMDIQSFRAFKLVSDFRSAYEEDQLEYYFQPKVNLDTYKIVGVEALFRWNHPDWGALSPKEFLPFIEDQTLLSHVSKKINWKIAEQVSSWNERGLLHIPVSTNLSVKRFFESNLVKNFQEVLMETKLEPEFVEIEITEASMLENEKLMLKTLSDLTKTGVSISLDDFGTGYSSLSYLTKFKKYISTLKIDSSFIANLQADVQHESNLITQAMIKLAEVLQMNIVANGVETYEQLELLKDMGCKVAQGKLFSEPLPAAEFEKLLLDGTIHLPLASQLKAVRVEESRNFFRIPLHFPLSGSMTLTRINGRKVDVGQTTVLIEDIGLGGLRFLSDLKLTVNPNIILEFETILFAEPLKLLGSIVWALEIKPDIYQYGIEFSIVEGERTILTPLLNKLAINLRKAPLVPDCSFITEDRYTFIKNLRK